MINAHNLCKEYGTLKALDDISFSCNKGQICGFVGHNGAGKTTLLKICSGLISPTSGSLDINGVDVVSDPILLKENLGYLPEESRLYETMTVPDYLMFFGEIYGLSHDTIRKREHELLLHLSLDHSGKKIGNLSKGMKRKVAIARSLMHDPSFLVYDEPNSGLDPMTSRYITEYLETLKKQGKTILLSAHNLYQIEQICDQVIIIRRGKIVAKGSMQELRERFGSVMYEIYYTLPSLDLKTSFEQVKLTSGLFMSSTPSVDTLNQITTELKKLGGHIDRIESKYPSLEEMLVKIGK